MNTQLRLKRSANTLLETAAHGTITKIVASPVKQFGFAQLDSGEEIYIPAMVIKRNGLSPQDVGAGFKCHLRDFDTSRPLAEQKRSATLPFTFDDTAPEIVSVTTPGPTEAEVLHQEVDALLAKLDEVETVRQRLDATHAQCDAALSVVETCLDNLTTLQTSLRKAREGIDTARVSVNAAEVSLDGVHRWVDATYPE